jgi:hypothetical protein
MGNIIQQLSRTLPENQHYIDLSGAIHAQSNYLTTISTQTNDPDLKSKITNVQSSLDQLNTDFKQANASSSAVLDHQQKMVDIVDTEKNRLLQKKQTIDNALDGRRRAAVLNESYRQRYSQYAKMVILVTGALVVYVILVLISRFLPFIPSFIFGILYSLLFSVCLIQLYIMYSEINSRDKMYFDQIDLDGPTILSPEQISKNAKDQGEAGNLLGSINLGNCIGPACCSDASGTIWDISNSVCVAKDSLATTSVATTNGFTTLSATYSVSKPTTPNSPNEFEGYTFV